MPDLTDEQVWERVYQRHGVDHGKYPVNVEWHRAHLALNVLWPEIVASKGFAVIVQSGGDHAACFYSFYASRQCAPDPATAIARLWGEVVGAD